MIQKAVPHSLLRRRWPCRPEVVMIHGRFLSSSSSNSSNNDSRSSSVLIVGGGPSGLLMANLLEQYQVDYTLLEAQSTQDKFRHPQAHFMNTRTMEILKHALPPPKVVYDNIQQSMRPVEEWKRFYFGSSMTTSSPLATVVHPVDRPLLSGVDANGVLEDEDSHQDGHYNNNNNNNNNNSKIPLSDCSVGHLAQHTFSKILYDAIPKNANNNKLYYGTRVMDRYYQDQQWHVTTNDGKTFSSPLVIAADGAKSEWRQSLNIAMKGQGTIQHLINVHFTIQEEEDDDDDSSSLVIPPAMLYTIFSPSVLCMVVRHGRGEYVMQIPYFPPYQTLEEDFSHEKVQHMVQQALGGDGEDNNNNNNKIQFQIQSIQPWTMGSLVAESYFHQNNVYLVGDAAHVFPPAGGFGMNTGLQDVFSLAWRLALLHAPKQQLKNGTRNFGPVYQAERQAVASSNAALSVRNYQRVLGVMQACYLHHQHPAALIAGLEATARFVPMEVRRKTFQTLLQTALWPLGQLQTDQSPFTKHIQNNLRHLLGSGQGLPLLFPNHEVGFSYERRRPPITSEDEDDNWSRDTMAPLPKLEKGIIFPHMAATVVSGQERYPGLSFLSKENNNNVITLRDLPAQLTTIATPCVFCVLEIQNNNNVNNDSSSGSLLFDDARVMIQAKLKDELGIPSETVLLTIGGGEEEEDASKKRHHHYDNNNNNIRQKTADGLHLCVAASEVQGLEFLLQAHNNNTPMVVVIRPDGHVASILTSNTEMDVTRVLQETSSCLGESTADNKDNIMRD